MHQLEVRVTHGDGTLTVTPVGEIDMDSAPLLSEAVHRAAAGWATHIVIDLAAVTFIDSAGVHALYALHRKAQANGGAVSVSGAGASVQRVLHLTGALALLAPRPPGSARPGLN